MVTREIQKQRIRKGIHVNTLLNVHVSELSNSQNIQKNLGKKLYFYIYNWNFYLKKTQWMD